MDLVYTDDDWAEAGTTSAFTLDVAYGSDENDFSAKAPPGIDVPMGALMYIDGTGYGGIVRGIEDAVKDGVAYTVYTGPTWHGVLASKVIRPDSGAAYYTVTGDLNANIAAVVSRVALGSLFDVESIPCGKSATYTFERYCDAYAGICKMLAVSGCKLAIAKGASAKPLLSAVPAADCSDDGQTYEMDRSMKVELPVNHLVCLGSGELAERTVIDLYADSSGNVSKVQTLFGIDEVCEVYDYPNSEDSQLEEDGRKRLAELQACKSAELSAPDGIELDIGDTVGVHDDDTGRSLTAQVSKVIVKVSEAGLVTRTYELGDIEAIF